VPKSYEQFLRETVFRKKDIDRVVDPRGKSWVRFDSYQGYLGNDIELRDGLGGSTSVYSYEPTGERKKTNYADQPCRVNTYGNSYTLCQQVSDGETWQEHLAAHLQEPIRNFGIGGQGVLHAFLRMKQKELQSATSAPYVILNVFEDDHLRSIEPARRIRELSGKVIPESTPTQHVMGFPWAYLRYDLPEHRFVMHENPVTRPEELFQFCEPGSFWEMAKDNLFIQLLALWNKVDVSDISGVETLADEFGLSLDFRNPAIRSDSAWTLGLAYGIRATQYILQEARAFTQVHGKQLLIVTSYSGNTILGATEKGNYMGREFSEFLRKSDYAYHDTMPDYVADFSNAKNPRWAIEKHFVKPAGAAVWGHLNPVGNQWYASYVREFLVNHLNPKPKAYAQVPS